MKGISGNPVLDAYQRMAISPVRGAPTVQGPAPVAPSSGTAENAQVQISAKARGLATGADAGIDATKVADLKKKIDAGELRLDHDVIAQRMLQKGC